MKIVCKTKFGSHLYGTATPTSDIDIRGVFLLSKKDILLGRIPKTNKEQDAGKEDDYELYSLHHFIKLACEGQTLAFDMLWTPETQVELGDAGHVWTELRTLRHHFLSKRMNAFIGYARGQAAKYSLKGERLSKLEAFLGVLKQGNGIRPLNSVWDALPKDDVRKNAQGVEELQIAGKWFGRSTQIHFVQSSVQGIVDAYGERAKASREGVDWKAMSHAVRVSLELRELLETREIKFPLTNADLVLQIKKGELPLETVQAFLDELLIEVELLTAASDLPEQVDRNFWDNWLADCVERHILGS